MRRYVKQIKHNNYSFGYFTSNTLRLALDSRKKVFYTSAIGKKAIYCVDCDGIIKWHKVIPSPREIQVVPTLDPNSTHILIASNKENAVYQIKKKTIQHYRMVNKSEFY